MRSSIYTYFKVAPEKIIQWIKIRAVRRPVSLLDEVVAVLLQPGEGLVEDMAGGRVLLPHPGMVPSNLLDSGKYDSFHYIQIHVCVHPEASLKDVWRHHMVFRTDDSKHHHSY